MGYFSNGSEGEGYEQQYCSRCLHNDPANGCPVWDAHLLHAYGENGKNSAGEQILDMLIPRAKDGLGNKRCVMFLGKVKR